ncbi:MAG: serine hydrolase [Ruminococcus sp.]|nr:serine hydrolase [Ruminococcus sp.]
MKKQLSAAVCAAAILMTGCGNSITPLDPLNPIDREYTQIPTVTTTTAAAPPEESVTASVTGTSAPEQSESVTETEIPPEQTTPSVTETPAPTETEKQTTPAVTVPMDPVPVDQNVIASSSVWFSGITTVGNNDEFRACVDELNKLVASYGYKIGFAYENMVTGASIRYNAATRFPSCSTIKVPYVKSLIDSGIDLDEQIPIIKAWYNAEPEPGHLTGADIGKSYPARKLIANAVSLSDNTAYINLIEHYGRYVFNAYAQNHGTNIYLTQGYYFTPLTAGDLLTCYKDVYKLGEATETGKWLCELMQQSSFNMQIGAALGDKYPVSHKYGTDCETNSYHDVAICYAEKPFVLVIMTEQVPETEAANKMFRDAALVFDRLNNVILG